MVKSGTSIKMATRSELVRLILVGSLVALINLSGRVEARDKGGDDIILTKGKIIMRGGKGKGNIILDPGSHSGDEGGHSMAPMMSLMGHFNPYAFYPMQQQQHHHHQPHHSPMMIQPIYIEDHSALNHHHHQPEQHHEQHHEQHMYHHEEPQQQHYEQQQHHHDMGHHQEHYEPQHHEQQHYEHEGGEHEGGGGGHGEVEHHHGGYEHHQHPLMAMMMHGSGPQPAYQQLSAMQAMQQHPGLYAQQAGDPRQLAYQVQLAAAVAEQQLAQQQQQATSPQAQSSNEVSHSSSSGSTSSGSSAKPTNKAIALLEKTAANNPLVQIIRPLFKRNKDHNKDAANQQKKP